MLSDQDGGIVSEPSDGKFIPPVSHEALLAQSPCPVLDPTWNKGREENTEGHSPTPKTPKRDGAPLGEPDRKMAKTGDAAASEMEEKAQTQRRKIGLPLAKEIVPALQEQLRRVGLEPD